MNIKKEQVVKVLYTNWRGETKIRTIIPKKIYYGSTDWHPKEGWLLEAFDLDRNSERIYSLKDIKSWWTEEEKQL